MKITLSPIRSDARLTLHRAGDGRFARAVVSIGLTFRLPPNQGD